MKKRKYFVLAIYSLMLFGSSCSGSKNQSITNEFKKGDYNFSFSDSTGNKLIEGTMTLDTNTENFTGTYRVTQKYVDTFPGLTTLQGGALIGTYSQTDNKLFINMNPKLADANIFIKGKVFRDSLIGEWSYSTIMGVKVRGSFIALPKQQ